MHFEKQSIPSVVAAYAQQSSTRVGHVRDSFTKMRFEWVLIRDQHNADDMQALQLFILNICDTLKTKTNNTEFEKRMLNMAQLFTDVYAYLENKSKGLCATINAPDLWQAEHTNPAPISMQDLHTDAFTKRLTGAKPGERHDIFIYEMISYESDSLQIDRALRQTKKDPAMHVLFEVLLHAVCFRCTKHPEFAMKPMFIGYDLGNSQATHSLDPKWFPHYVDFAQRDELLYQLVPLVLPRKWKAVPSETSGLSFDADG